MNVYDARGGIHLQLALPFPKEMLYGSEISLVKFDVLVKCGPNQPQHVSTVKLVALHDELDKMNNYRA